MPPPHQIVSPLRRSTAEPAASFAQQTAIRHEQDADDRRRFMLAASVVCTGLIVAGVALWQARNARTVYVPILAEPVTEPAATVTTPTVRRFAYTAPSAVAEFTPAVSHAPVSVAGVVSGNPSGTVVRTAAAPALPQTWTPPPAFAAPALVDHAARNQQIEDLKSRIEALDEDVRCVREHPTDPRYSWHYCSSTYRGVDQARRDAYLKELDKQRNDLRRQKWALEGR